MRLKVAAAVLGIAAFGAIASPTTAYARFRDTPTFLMEKGLNSNLELKGGWQLRCSKRWHPSGESYWAGKCSLHKREGSGPGHRTYDGYGIVALHRVYRSFYWSWYVSLRVRRYGRVHHMERESSEMPLNVH
jgi:hypothetical protein